MRFIWETPEEINLALAQRLRGIRKRKNLTQQQLSEKSNVSFFDFADKAGCRAGLHGGYETAVCGCKIQFHRGGCP